MRLIDADHFIATLDTVVQKHESVLWQKIAETMKFMIEAEAKMFPIREIIYCKDCKHWMRAYLGINGKHGCNVMRDYTAPNDYCFKAERKEDAKNSVDM